MHLLLVTQQKKQIGFDDFCNVFNETKYAGDFNLEQKKIIFEFLEEKAKEQKTPLEIDSNYLENRFEAIDSIFSITEDFFDIEDYLNDENVFDEEKALKDLEHSDCFVLDKETNGTKYFVLFKNPYGESR